MPLVTIPNVSEGRDASMVSRLSDALVSGGCRLLDVHVDPGHNRSVFTATGDERALVDGLAALAYEAVSSIDLTRHEGAHPRVGALDVCPVVPHLESMDVAIEAARAAGEAIARRAHVPVYLYDRASGPGRTLPEIRTGGLGDLIERAKAGFAPDLGPRTIDPRRGVVCVGARATLIAFNVWLRSSRATAAAIARVVRERDGGVRGVRALGLELDGERAQVSMNLTEPERTGIEAAFDAVAAEAAARGADVLATEIVGLVPERFLPAPDAQADGLPLPPGRSLESVLIV
jgi:glutamate formiminotransferase